MSETDSNFTQRLVIMAPDLAAILTSKIVPQFLKSRSDLIVVNDVIDLIRNLVRCKEKGKAYNINSKRSVATNYGSLQFINVDKYGILAGKQDSDELIDAIELLGIEEYGTEDKSEKSQEDKKFLAKVIAGIKRAAKANKAYNVSTNRTIKKGSPHHLYEEIDAPAKGVIAGKCGDSAFARARELLGIVESDSDEEEW